MRLLTRALGKSFVGSACAVICTAALLLVAPAVVPGAPMTPTASAACPAVEVIFARGRTEPQGLGILGNAFVSALRSKTNKNIDSYAVRYPADNEIDVGANDMSSRIQDMAGRCPDTRLVLGGYSLGAAVTDVVLAVPMPFFGFDKPLPPGVDTKIAAVALFGNGSAWAGPIGAFNPLYRERTIELCHGADPKTWENNWSDHLANAYIKGGMVTQAADFVAGRV